MATQKTDKKSDAEDDDGIVKADPTITITSPISGSTIGGTVTVWGTYENATEPVAITCELWDGSMLASSAAMALGGLWSANLTVPLTLPSPTTGLEIRAYLTQGNIPYPAAAVIDLTYQGEETIGIYIHNPGTPLPPRPLAAGTAAYLYLQNGIVLEGDARRLSAVHTLYIFKGKVLGEPLLAKLEVDNSSCESIHRFSERDTNKEYVSLVVIGHRFDNRGKLITTTLSHPGIKIPPIS